ncbi:gamma-aminobutyric acid type B receptor subunit 2-like isoform X3 [Anthonomus grandis grandis]|uniref:gamma-aminobutyric acid type B receptor subunit 2-like isoform X3 n=1 Tax=Anthonomus grandis grandis TaxID=2921223 RepID=UPI0021653C7A|nr:gamma-aminobutyric acid type B receptor subunit 2-like isoform X3 [Anthonomus grandis grandis]
MQTYYTIPLMVVHPFQKPFCVLFISLALLFYFLQSRKEVPYNMKFVSKENSTATLTGDIFENPFKGFPNPNESSSREGFDILKFLNSSLLGDDETEKSLGTNEIKHVYILGLFELTRKNGERRKEGESELMAARIAVQHVNALNILPGYKLALLVNDTQCDPGVAIDRLFHTIYSNKTIVMLLGAGCSNVSEALAHIVPYWNIIQVSYGSKSPILSDRNKFPLFFRTVAPDSSHNIAKTHFIKHHFWQVVVAFSQSENRYLLPINHLITELERENVSCVSTVTFTLDNYKEQLIFLKNLDIRIIIGSFSLRMAPLIFCKAFELGIYGNEYLWILENHDIPWWLNQPGDCDKNALKIAIEGAIMVGDYDYSEESPTKSEEYITKYANTIANVSRYAKQSYDAIWTMALTLSSFNPDFVTNFDYGKHEVVCGFFEVMKRLKFVGLSGPIKFHGADRIGDFVVSQIQGGQLKNIALYDSIRDKLDFDCYICHKVVWKNGQIPIAQRILKTILLTIPTSLFYLTSGISAIGIICSLLFLYFNLKFRQMKNVKLSSPNLNNLTVIGCILVYLSVIIFAYHSFTKDTGPTLDQLCLIERCECHNTLGWHIALFGYKTILLIIGVLMAWKTRHIKIPALNDSQYIGICVYSAIFTTIIVIVFSFVTDYFILSFIAKTGSILISTSTTLALLFVPKIKSTFGSVDHELSIMESMGLKIQYNTRRFILDDPKELLCRLEIQNKAYKSELESLDREICRLESILDGSDPSSSNTMQTFPEVYYLEVPRASWPIWHSQSIKTFSSDSNVKSVNFFGKFKKFFGSLASLQYGYSSFDAKQMGIGKDIPKSNPEISDKFLVPYGSHFGEKDVL